MHDRMTVTCPTPRSMPTGEMECPACGLRWEWADGRPECNRKAVIGNPFKGPAGNAYKAAKSK